MAPSELTANPKNWRSHGKAQRAALSGLLGEVGVVQGVVFNKRTGLLVDGHLRVELAVKNGEDTVPVTVVDLSEEEEALVLATLDPIGAMAGTEAGAFLDLVDLVSTENDALKKLIDKQAIEPGVQPPAVTGGKGDVRTFIFTVSPDDGEAVDKAFAKLRAELKEQDDGKVFVAICSRV